MGTEFSETPIRKHTTTQLWIRIFLAKRILCSSEEYPEWVKNTYSEQSVADFRYAALPKSQKLKSAHPFCQNVIGILHDYDTWKASKGDTSEPSMSVFALWTCKKISKSMKFPKKFRKTLRLCYFYLRVSKNVGRRELTRRRAVM